MTRQLEARIAGGFYLVTIVAGAAALGLAKGRTITNLLASVSYIVVTLLFYDLFKPVNRTVSILAAIVSLVGCTLGIIHSPFNNIVLFGFYCVAIGYLIYRSGFLPRTLGVLMAIGGLGWLTYLSPTLGGVLAPYNMALGVLGETALTLWLLVRGTR